MEMPPPGWYEDPAGAGYLLRWWDGSQWTARTGAMKTLTDGMTNGVPVEATAPVPEAAHSPMPGAGEALMPKAATPDGAAALDGRAPTELESPADNSTHVLELDGAPWHQGHAPWKRDAGPALGTTSWAPNGTSVSAPAMPIWEPGGPTTPPRLNRTRLMWGLGLATAVAVMVTAGLVAILGSPGTHVAPVAAAQQPAAVGNVSPGASPSAPSPTPAATTGTPVTDAASGLSYAMLAGPWQAGCPTQLSNSTFAWTGGESAVAGTVGSGVNSAWYGSACSGLLSQQYPYTGVADLAQTATNLVNAFDPAYYNGLPHSRSNTVNNPLQVSGHPAWMVKFVMTYPTAASQGLPWQSELGAVVVVDRGTGQPPAVLFVTVPDNLGLSNVDVILQSAKLAAPPPATAPPAGGSPPPAPPAGDGSNP
jgi:hypothetical protein